MKRHDGCLLELNIRHYLKSQGNIVNLSLRDTLVNDDKYNFF